MSLHVQRLQLRLPAGYAARARGIGEQIAHACAQLQPSQARSLANLTLAPIRVAAGASDAQITQAVLQQLAAALEVQA